MTDADFLRGFADAEPRLTRGDAGALREIAENIQRLHELAGRVVVAYHVRHHARFSGKHLYEECQEPFCVEARALGLPSDELAEAQGGDK